MTQMIILTLKPEEAEKKKRRFFKRKPQKPVFITETVFINSAPHYKISAEPRCFSDDGFLNALKSHSGQIAAADGVLAIARPVIEPLLFDASDFLKHCAFSGLLRYLKGGMCKKDALFIKDSRGTLKDVLKEALPFVKSLTVLSTSPFYNEDFINGAFFKYGAQVKVTPFSKKPAFGYFADFDALEKDDALFLDFKEKSIKIRPEIKRKKTEGAAKLRALGIAEKYIYSAF